MHRTTHVPGSAGAASSRVLLLNASFEPLIVLPTRRAVVLLLADKAEVIHDDESGRSWHAASLVVAVPSVIRLRYFVKVPFRATVPLTRDRLMRRDNHRCAYCGGRAETVDHVVPRSRGGSHTWENCVASCRACNHRKGDRLLDELGWSLQTRPHIPRGPRLVFADLITGVVPDPRWTQFLAPYAA